MKKYLLCVAVTSSLIAVLFGCGVFSKDSGKGEDSTTIVADKATDESDSDKSNTDKQENQGTTDNTTDNTTESTTDTTEESTTVSFEGDVNNISNNPVTWGVGVQKYDDNRPVSPVQLQEQFGSKYAVDFIKENEKVIYLTFDEGYENGYTGKILDTLKEKNVKAVFFITMPYAKSEPELIRRMIDEGHVVGAHSVTHPSEGMPSLTVEQQINEYQELHKYVEENYGYKMYLFRPPTGRFSEQSLAVAQKCGYRSVMWSFAYNDWNPDSQPEVSKALENAVGKLHNGAIYLLHAVSATNTEMLGSFIDQTEAKGYVFKEYK